MRSAIKACLFAPLILVSAAHAQGVEYCSLRDPGCIPKSGGEVLIYGGEAFAERDHLRTQAARIQQQRLEEARLVQRRRREAALREAQEQARALAKGSQHEVVCSDIAPPVQAGATNPHTGEFYAPSGSGFVSTRDGTYYAPAGPSNVLNTRTGQLIPVTSPQSSSPVIECTTLKSRSRRRADDYHRGTRSIEGGMINKRSVEFGGGGR